MKSVLSTFTVSCIVSSTLPGRTGPRRTGLGSDLGGRTGLAGLRFFGTRRINRFSRGNGSPQAENCIDTYFQGEMPAAGGKFCDCEVPKAIFKAEIVYLEGKNHGISFREGRDQEGRDWEWIRREGRDFPPVPSFKDGTRKLCFQIWITLWV